MPIFSGTNAVLRNWILKSIDQYRTSLKRVKGFTLIELLVVLAIMGILSVLSLASFQGSGRRQDVKNAASQLKTELRKYQNFAISGQKVPDPDPSNQACANEILSGYQIIIDTSVSPATYEARILCDNGTIFATLATSVPWSSDVEITEVGRDTATTCTNDIVIGFLPVNDGVVLLCNAPALVPFDENVYIRVSKPGGGAYKVFVTYGGEIVEQKD